MPKRSSGILLWRRGPAGPEVLLAHPGGPLFARKDDAHWSIPKGEHDPGEESWAAAQREFGEELGLGVPAGEPVALGEVRQSSGKINAIWALEGDLDVSAISSNDFTLEWPPRSGRIEAFPEMDRAAWFDLPTARRKLFPAQVPFLDRLAAVLDARSA